MPHFTWTVELDQQPYTVEFEYGYWSGKRLVYVNGQLVHKSSKFVNVGRGEYPFQIGAHTSRISIHTDKKQGFLFTLYVDDTPPETQILSSQQLLKMLFPILSLILLIIILDGAVALVWSVLTGTIFNTRSLLMFAVFVVFAAAIWFVAGRKNFSKWLRIAICIALTLVNVVIALSIGITCACDYIRNAASR